MRILHTGDWHLGRTLLGADLLEHQAAFTDWLVDLARERAVDLVVIAGDVYDRAIPPVDAVRMLSRVLERLAETTTVVLTPGNHDSAARLGFGAGVMGQRVRILAEPAHVADPVLVPDDDGAVAVYGIPYLHPDLTRYALAAVPDEPLARSHHAVVHAATERIRADLATRADPRSVVVAHAFVGGADPSDSEQDIRVGGVDRVAESVFDGFDYVALGHLHGPQRVGDDGRIRYAGSPLAFSFGERHQRKSVTIADLDAAGAVTVELVPTPVPRRLVDVRGSIDAIESGEFRADADAWVRVAVTDTVHPERMYARVKDQFPHALAITHEPADRPAATAARAVTATSDPVEVAGDFVAFATGGLPDDDERAVLTEAYEAAALALQREGDR
ncbi:exonuclease SbcCD subunit D [Curtobacterium flaccumfaciens pv. flaccumfaciens]|uniref:metallophosphoesterase family protein n=1 Tax=Curtobacterium flaccumfaciens TaxID=2035 RepID=UPI00217ED36F|nr:exonuclease SbcCD subunit D [Curtobacterium flaccumfaciens]MCS6568950.1 exonuclease SbcCD subunit D [Curtobacterium flaccumfaciens pv. flaccumfaciens]MCS6584798.1 exonuclease SbcCD subunit D [Curtobacterium flaccumfaciens pv. flaccumfaciens]